MSDLLSKLLEAEASPFKPATPEEVEGRKDASQKAREAGLKKALEGKLTVEQIMDWVGNEGYVKLQIEVMAETLCDIANHQYAPMNFKYDVIEHSYGMHND